MKLGCVLAVSISLSGSVVNGKVFHDRDHPLPKEIQNSQLYFALNAGNEKRHKAPARHLRGGSPKAHINPALHQRW